MSHSLRPVFACIFDWLKTGHVHVMFLLFLQLHMSNAGVSLHVVLCQLRLSGQV